MYNYQTFRKEQLLTQHCQRLKQQHLHTEGKRQQSCPSLAHSHKKRVEGFILSSIDKPVPVTQYSNAPHCFRSTAGPTLGPRGFYLRRQSQSQRIENIERQHSELDAIPFSNSANHKFREFKGKGLKYKPMSQTLRVKQFLQKQQLNYLPNSPIKQDKLVKKALTGDRINILILNKSIGKSMLPNLHAKTYFKSVSTLFTEIPTQNNRKQQSCSREQVSEEVEGERRISKPKDHLSRKQNSKQALTKCNMLACQLRA